MDICTINFADKLVGDRLRSLVGNNDVAYWNYVNKCFDANGIKEDFKNWYENTFKKECKDTDRNFAARMIQYYNEHVLKVGKVLRDNADNSDVRTFSYPSIADREEGIRHSVAFILNHFLSVQNQGLTTKGNKRDYYKNILVKKYNDVIFNYIANRSNKTIEAVTAEYDKADNKHTYLAKAFGGKNITITGRNLLAVHDELNSEDTLTNYFNECLANPNLQSVLRQVNDEKEEDDVEAASQEEARDNEEEGNTESDVHIKEDEGDDFIAAANSHMGAFTSYTKHLGTRITNYFNSLYKLASPVGSNGNYSYDTNTNFGIPETMDASECSMMLYSHARFNNQDEMISSIEQIAYNMPDFYAFKKFADDLRSDRDLATEVFSTFAKTIMEKVETVLSDDRGSVRISNEAANPSSAMLFDMMNDSRGTIIDIPVDIARHNVSLIKGDIDGIVQSLKTIETGNFKEDVINETKAIVNQTFNTIIDNLKNIIKSYFPSVQTKAIESYINSAEDTETKIRNLYSLVMDLNQIIKGSEQSQEKYIAINAEIEKARDNNNRLKTDAANNKFVDFNDMINLSELYNKDYLSDDVIKGTRSIMLQLLPYSSINVSLNSRNVYGNQSSDIINNSMITYLTKMLRLTYKDKNGRIINEALSTWGRNRFRSKQYDYSGILLEHRDEDGNIINRGLFKDKNGTLSEDAEHLIELALFNGSSNLDNNTNAVYADQTTGVYLPTEFINFFNTGGGNATYFLRTPSDAPKTFCIQAPKYNTRSLIKFEDDSEKINTIINDYNRYDKENPPTDYYTPGADTVADLDSTRMYRAMTNQGNILVINDKAIKYLDKKTGEAVVSFALKSDKDYRDSNLRNKANGKRYFFRGTIEKSGKAYYLKDYKFDGILGYNDNEIDETDHLKEMLMGYYQNQLKLHDLTINGKTYEQTKQYVDKNDILFKRFENEAKQELLNAAIAINHYFETTNDGNIIFDTNKSDIRKPRFRKGRSNTIGYKNYHLGKNGKVLDEIKKGNKIVGYRLAGRVFGSEKFTLNVNKNGTIVHHNYVQEALFSDEDGSKVNDGKIHFFYGGAVADETGKYVGTYLNTIKDENGDVVDIVLNDKQKETLDKALEDFILDYTEQAAKDVEPYKEFMRLEYNKDNINDFAINSFLMHCTYDDLFEGSTLFYKSGQDVLKRAKEYQGSGVPYGVVDYLNDDGKPNEEVKNSYLNTGLYVIKGKELVMGNDGVKHYQETITPTSIQDIFKGTIFEGTKQTTKFRAITIANTQRTSEAAAQNGAIVEYLSKVYQMAGVEKEKALDMANRLMKGYEETKVNDAQSYITVQEWVRRIAARGQLKKYMPLIQKLIKEEPLSLKEANEFVQVQKNFYYDMHYDRRYGIVVPRQIKNAEFVLIPQFIKGTELEAVYDMMRKADIQQLNTVETSKAANEEVLTLWDNEGKLSGILESDGTIDKESSKSKFNQFVAKANELATGNEYSYKFLYTQQETPQHMDAQNKFGIQIAKKIIDNIELLNNETIKSTDDELTKNKKILSKIKRRYMNLVSENIRDSFSNLMEELEIPIDEDGNIIIDEQGNIQNINSKIFYDKLKQELIRTGADKNVMDYVTIEDGKPKMKAITVDKITKFESVVQSVFNNRITRQKLPGFHAAQVTNMGFKKLGEMTGVTNVSYDKDLAYHPLDENGNPQGYIEVRLPYSTFGIDITKPYYQDLRKKFTDENGVVNEADFQDAILKELKADGLDMIIGYRIPTEGKQSVCNMKVVSFLDNSQGSTIIVPGDWVSQTGSDFDIDSVYGINQKIRTRKDGKIIPIKFIEGEVTIGDYANYLRRFATDVNDDNEETKLGNRKKAVGNAINKIFKETLKDVNESKAEIKADFQEEYDKLMDSQAEAFERFVHDESNPLHKIMGNKNTPKSILGGINKGQKIAIERLDIDATKNEKFIAQLSMTITYLNNVCKKKKIDYTKVPVINDFTNANAELIDFLKNQRTDFNELVSSELDDIFTNRQIDLENIAEQNGLLSFADFQYAALTNPEKINSRDARTNEIFNCMKNILLNPLALEENLSRSNSDDILDALKKYMNPNIKAERENRSAYNPFDQIKYQEEAMSGAKLKAFSVMLDTFCSVCNTVKPILTKPIYVVYEKSDYPDPSIIQKRFNDTSTKNLKSLKTFGIRHTTYGWSTDNRCAAGKILTSYSSQTTAYILDAIKSGAIPNVNDYTFAVFKTLANIGCDYKASISFIMQDGIKEIVDAYNSSHSIFSDYQGGNPINEAIKNIGRKLGYKVDNRTSAKAVLEKIDKDYHKEFNKLFAQKGEEITIGLKDEDVVNLPILVGKNVDRLKGTGEFELKENSPVEEINAMETKKSLYDLGVILSFNKIYKTANEIGNIVKCCNPDKFGAKQDVYSTNKIFDDAIELVNNHKSVIDGNEVTTSPIVVDKDGKYIHILESIYPGITDNTPYLSSTGIVGKNRIAESSYPSLYSYLKYASATSTVVARKVLPTQELKFTELVKGFANKLSGFDRKLNAKTYKDVQSYALSEFYNEAEFVKYPIAYTIDNNGKLDVHLANTEDEAIDNERRRIYGFGQNIDLSIPKPRKVNKYKRIGSTNTYASIETYNKLPDNLKVNYELKEVTTYDNVAFKVEDIHHPTNEELEDFAKLSPAQKVQFIKSNFEETGVFSKLKVSLYNPAKRGYRAGSQTIEYIQDNSNANIVYEEFYNAFFDKNPLVAMTAYDLVKYAAVVEGFKMSQRAVCKIIDNRVLIGEFGNTGTGFQDSVYGRIVNFNNKNSIIDIDGSQDKLYEDFLRSHPFTEGLKLYSVTKKNNSKYHLDNLTADMMILRKDKTVKDRTDKEIDDEFIERAEKIGLVARNTANNSIHPNAYVKFKSKARGIEIYKIEHLGDEIIVYPLNRLNANEHGAWSVNESYNVHLRGDAYKYIIAQYKADKESVDIDSKYIADRISEYKRDVANPYYNRIRKTSKGVVDFNLDSMAENEYGSAYMLKESIIKHFTSLDSNKPFRVKNLMLSNYIVGAGQSSLQTLTMPDGSKRDFQIIKEDLSEYNKTFLNHKDDKSYRSFIADKIKDPLLKKLYTEAIENDMKYVNDVYRITDVTTTNNSYAMRATVEESDLSALEFINLAQKGQRNVRTGLDGEASLEVQATQQAKVQGIKLKTQSIKNNVDDATRIVAEYAIKKGKELETRLNQFIEDPQKPGTYLSASDERVIDIIKDNPIAINNFFKMLNEISAYKTRFAQYKACEIDSDSPAIRKYVKDINKAYDGVAALNVDKANRNIMENYIAKFSTNPLIREGVLDVADNYYKTYGSMWMFHDIAENGNPLLQNILKDVYGHIEARRMATDEKIRKVKAHIEEIKKKAKAEGFDVDINKIISADGELIQDYSKEFLDKMEELRRLKNEAAKLGKGYGSIEYLIAKNNYDQYKAVYTNQEAKQEYYIQRAYLEREMINHHPKIYSAYMTLLYKQLDIYNYMTENGIPEEKQAELDKIQQEMINLSRPTEYYIENGVSKVRPDERDGEDDFMDFDAEPKDYEAASIYDIHEAYKLNEFLQSMRSLNSKYFEYKPKYGFEDLLNKNLNVIAAAEKADANGVPTQSQEVLQGNKEYVAAKKWVRENAQYVVDTQRDEEGHPVNPLADKIIEALKRLSLSGNGNNVTVNRILKHANNNKGIKDSRGVYDGTLLTDDEIKEIKDDIIRRYNIQYMPEGSDKILINNAKPTNEILNAYFYRRFNAGKKIFTKEYFDVVTRINQIHSKYYNVQTGTINFENIPDNEEGYKELDELAELYQQYRELSKSNEVPDDETKDFRAKYTQFKTNEELYNRQINELNKTKSVEFRTHAMNVVFDRMKDGTLRVDKDTKAVVPNRLLYSYLTLNDELTEDERKRFIDKHKQEDINLLDKAYTATNTIYWERAKAEAMKRSYSDPSFDYNKWWNDNHVYNPYTRKMELLPCWTTRTLNKELMEDGVFVGKWQPKSNQRIKKVKDGNVKVEGLNETYYMESEDMRNKNYKEDSSLAANYIKGASEGKYDNKTELNPYEKELRDYIQNLLISTAGNHVSRRYFESGRLPQRKKADNMDVKGVTKEIGKLLGFGVSSNNGRKDFDEYVGYDNDVTPIMPMLKDVTSTKTTKVKKLEELESAFKSDYTIYLDKDVNKKPVREEYESDEDYIKALAEYEAIESSIKKHNEEVRKKNLDTNWLDVISDYMSQAARYNAIQDSKEKLYWLLNELKHQQAYIRKFGGSGDLRLDTRRSTEDNNVYQTALDDNLIKQYENQLRRLLWDEWKEPENHLTRWANQLQTFTSANYMMLNIRGGISNVTLGVLQGITSEALSKEQFNKKDIAFGFAEISKNTMSFAQGMYDTKGYSLADAAIKMFKSVDYDEITGVVRSVGLAKWSERVRNAGFSPQTMGEFFMQNGVLLAMLHNHKVVAISDDVKNIGFRIMNEREYWNYKKLELIKDILTEEQMTEYNNRKEEIKKDPNLLKDYAWFRKDLATEIIKHFDAKTRKEYAKRVKEAKAKVSKEFNEKQDLYSQMELKDGYISFKQDSDLYKLNEMPSSEKGETVSNAYKLLGEFSEKVRKTNNYIHGVYNRQGMAYIEKTWYGSLVMQYHKHLPMGLMKRYHSRGNWNEFRNNVNKGLIHSCIDFMKLDIDLVKTDCGLTDNETSALKGVQNILTHSFQVLTHLKSAWEIAPDYDKANIKRNLGDLIGTLGGIMGAIALIAMGADDDEEDTPMSIVKNLALYESDRLASESFMYNPLGLQTELKTLMSTPLAAQSIITDGLKTIYEIGGFIMQGDDFDPIYHSGRFAGENKLSVYVQRRIPMWSGIRGVIDSPANNHYYKVGDRVCSLVNTKGIGNWIAGRGYDAN